MNGRQRIQLALNHQQPDRVPFDLGSSNLTGIHLQALRNLRRYLGLPDTVPPLVNRIEQIGLVDEDLRARLEVDVEGIWPKSADGSDQEVEDRSSEWYFRDEWHIGRRMPKDGLYFDLADYPLKEARTLADVAAFAWPVPDAPARFGGMAESARQITQQRGRACLVTGLTAGVMETTSWLRGFDSFYTDLVDNRELIEAIFDRVVELKMAYWEKALALLGDSVDVVVEADDLGTQNSLLISPRMYRFLLKPRHKRLFEFIHARTKAKLFFHSCGAVRPLIPDLIEVGVDILNPVQVSAAGMDTAELKREFGKDIVFWGGGVDTQHVLGDGTPDEVRREVLRRMSDLAPAGGFVFATVHCIQANVPPQNILAMWEAMRGL